MATIAFTVICIKTAHYTTLQLEPQGMYYVNYPISKTEVTSVFIIAYNLYSSLAVAVAGLLRFKADSHCTLNVTHEHCVLR